MAESCVIFRDGEDAVGDMLLFVLNLAQQDLGKEYKAIMQTVWGKGSEDKKTKLTAEGRNKADCRTRCSQLLFLWQKGKG